MRSELQHPFFPQLKFLVPSQASTVPSCQWLYIITFGGGLVEGVNVAVDIKVSENCTIVVTTQASTKVSQSVSCSLICSCLKDIAIG